MVAKTIIAKRTLIKNAVVFGSATAAALIGFYALYIRNTTLESEITAADMSKQNLSGQLAQAQKDFEDLSKAFDHFKAINTIRLPSSSGYETAAQRLREAQPIFEQLRNKHNLSDLDISFSTIADVTEQFGSQNFHVLQSDITLKFKGGTDAMMMMFLHDLMEFMPGYVVLSEFKIDRRQDTDQKGVDKFYLTSGEMVLKWYTLKENADKPATAPTQGS